MDFSPQLKQIILKYLPDGFPSQNNINCMDESQKEELFGKQNRIIVEFQKIAQNNLETLEKKLIIGEDNLNKCMESSKSPKIPKLKQIQNSFPWSWILIIVLVILALLYGVFHALTYDLE